VAGSSNDHKNGSVAIRNRWGGSPEKNASVLEKTNLRKKATQRWRKEKKTKIVGGRGEFDIQVD